MDEEKTEEKIPSSTHVGVEYKNRFLRRVVRILEYMLLPWEGPILGHRVFRSQHSIYIEKNRQRRVNHYIIHPFSRFRAVWDVFMVAVLFTTLIVLPVELAFYSTDLHQEGWIILNMFCDTTFLIDIIMNFRTGYLHEHTDEVILHNRQIWHHYVTGWFAFDLASSLPIDMMVAPGNDDDDDLVFARTLRTLRLARLLGLLKILRFARLMRYVRKIEEVIMLIQRKHQGTHLGGQTVTLVNLIFVIMVFAHWNGCIQYFVPSMMGFPEDSWPVLENLVNDTTVFDRYTHSVYRAMSHMVSIGYGHVMPQSTTEIWLTILSMMLGATFYAIFIGHISSFVMSLNYSGRKYEEKLAEVNEYMKFRKLPLDLQLRIQDYFEHRYQRKLFDEKGILNYESMSYPLRKEILMHNCHSLVEKVPFLAAGPTELIVDIITKLRTQVYFPGEVIIEAGRRGDAMFFIEHGCVEVRMANGRQIKKLKDGTHFGEIALLYEERRVASVVAIEVCDIYILSKHDFQEVLEDYPEMRSIMTRIARKRIRSIVMKHEGNHHDSDTDAANDSPTTSGENLQNILGQPRLAFNEEDHPATKSDSDTSVGSSERQPSMFYIDPKFSTVSEISAITKENSEAVSKLV